MTKRRMMAVDSWPAQSSWTPPEQITRRDGRTTVVALAMDDYLHHTRTDWSAKRLTARAKRLWGDGVWADKVPAGTAYLSADELQRWRRK